MDFHGMKRKELQALCKNHGIPANLTNREMADRLSSLLKEEEKTLCTDSEIDSVIVTKTVKKVRFSPENETFIFVVSDVESELGYDSKKNRTRKRKSTTGKNATKNKKVEEEDPVRVTRSKVQCSSFAVVEEDPEKGVRRGKKNVDKSRRESIRLQWRSRKKSGTFGDNEVEKQAKPRKVPENSKGNLKKKEKSSAFREHLEKTNYCGSRIPKARTRAHWNDSAFDNDSQCGAVIEIQEERPGVVFQIEEPPKGLTKKERVVSDLVVGEYIEHGAVLKSRKRAKNMESEEVSEIKPNVAQKQALHEGHLRRTRRSTRLFSLDVQLTTHETDRKMSPVSGAPAYVAKPTRRSTRNASRQVSIETSDKVGEIGEGVGNYGRTKGRQGPVLNEISSVVAQEPVNEKPVRKSKRNISKRKTVEQTFQESPVIDFGFAVPEAPAGKTDPALFSNKEITENSAVINQFDAVPFSTVNEEVTDVMSNLDAVDDITVEGKKGSMVENGESSLGIETDVDDHSSNLLLTDGDSGYGKPNEATECPNNITNMGSISLDNGFSPIHEADYEGECSDPLGVNERLEIEEYRTNKSINIQNDHSDDQSVEGDNDTNAQEDHQHLVEFDPSGNPDPVQDHPSEVSECQEPVNNAENWSREAEISCMVVPRDITKERVEESHYGEIASSNTDVLYPSTFVPESQGGIDVPCETTFNRDAGFLEGQRNHGKTKEPRAPVLPSVAQAVDHGVSKAKLQSGGSVLFIFDKNDGQVDDKQNREDSECCFDEVTHKTSDEKAVKIGVMVYSDHEIEKSGFKEEGEPGSNPLDVGERLEIEESLISKSIILQSHELDDQSVEGDKCTSVQGDHQFVVEFDPSGNADSVQDHLSEVSESQELVSDADCEVEKLCTYAPHDNIKERVEENHYGDIASSNIAVLHPSTFLPESQDGVEVSDGTTFSGETSLREGQCDHGNIGEPRTPELQSVAKEVAFVDSIDCAISNLPFGGYGTENEAKQTEKALDSNGPHDKSLQSDFLKEAGEIRDLSFLSKPKVDVDCFCPSADRVSKLHVHSAEFTTLSSGNDKEVDVKSLHEFLEEANLESKSGEKDNEVEENLVMTQNFDQTSVGRLGEHEHHTEPAVLEEIIPGDGESSNEKDDVSAIIQEYMERETHVVEGYDCDAIDDAKRSNVAKIGTEMLRDSGEEEDIEACALTSERTEVEEENYGCLLPLGAVAAERLLPEQTIEIPKTYHTYLGDSSVALSVIHEDPVTSKETVEIMLLHNEVKFADLDSNIEVSVDLDGSSLKTSRSCEFWDGKIASSEINNARVGGIVPDAITDDISNETKLLNTCKNEIVSTEESGDDITESRILSDNVEDDTKAEDEELSPCKFVDGCQRDEKSSADTKLLAGMESECHVERNSILKSEAMNSPIQGNNELGTYQLGSGECSSTSKETCWTDDVDYLDLNNLFSSSSRSSSKITSKENAELQRIMEVSFALSTDSEKNVQCSAFSSVTATSRGGLQENMVELTDELPLFTGFELNLFSEDCKREEPEKIYERNLEDNARSEVSEEVKNGVDTTVAIAQVSAEQCRHLDDDEISKVKNEVPVAFEDGYQERGQEANFWENISGSANPTRKSNSKYLVPVVENMDVSFGASKDTAYFEEVLSVQQPEKDVQFSVVSSRDCARLKLRENTMNLCDDFHSFTGLELNLSSEVSKREEAEKLLEAVASGDANQEKDNLLESIHGSANPPTKKSNTSYTVPVTQKNVQKFNAMKENSGTTKGVLVHSITASQRSKRRPLGDIQKN